MAKLTDVGLKVRNYKCFAEVAQGYDRILPVNLIVGRNNSGKSALLDLVDYATAPQDVDHLGHKRQEPEVIFRGPISEEELRQAFADHESGGPIGGNHWDFARQWIGRQIGCVLGKDGSCMFHDSDPSLSDQRVAPRARDASEIERRFAQAKKNPFAGLTFKRLLADRDMGPEAANDSWPATVSANGAGATNVIQMFINNANLPSELVEETLLRELNKIFEPDSRFTRLVVQKTGNSWELNLEEAGKGRVPLSHTGSGLKTVLLVLVFVHLVPYIESKQLDTYLFAFEELENNLHPALLRRLFLYLRKTALEDGCTFFLTTHSSVAIDFFSTDDQAQILHVTHDGEEAVVKAAKTYVENRGILDDLDVRASDLLQANGLVWLEGPSDRLYFNRWVELWSDGEIKEGTHYQCVFYGGRLLAHLSADDPTVAANDVVRILRLNRNAVIILDSDKDGVGRRLNQTKRRIVTEMEDMGGIAWVTQGKEIENYIPQEAFASLYRTRRVNALAQYEDAAAYLDGIVAGEGRRFLNNKVLYAERIVPHITKAGLDVTLDMGARLDDVLQQFRAWNAL